MTTNSGTPQPDPEDTPSTSDEPRLNTGDELASHSGEARLGGWGPWGDGVRLAVGTLSVVPAPMPRVVDRTVAGKAMVLAPLVGLLLGAIAAAVVAGVHALQPGAPLLAAVLGVVVLVMLSGGLHLDGLADTADGLGSRRDRETMLRIMKQSDIGPFGVVSIVAVLLIDVAALTACIQSGFGWQAILIATVASRLTLPWSCRTTVPSARPDGLGAMVASTVPTLAALITTTLTLAAVTLTAYADRTPAGLIEHTTGVASAPIGAHLLGAALALVVAIALGLLMIRKARAAFGGITGDTLGATVELALAAALLTLALTS
ncbi:adenosylcobinamide-GDP ribazoletransferase [Kribbella monticola]|uniref:adenosylcobinamide-GDP ribazoletransferase n=1 Tax=Kribbella monticola TaxID=2185285 RepID=UPI000DD3360D|nr:adenosylcobinamide-GDP ribazoletransferase [Kribbella monticola]